MYKHISQVVSTPTVFQRSWI